MIELLLTDVITGPHAGFELAMKPKQKKKQYQERIKESNNGFIFHNK
jgi:hypothetical protein